MAIGARRSFQLAVFAISIFILFGAGAAIHLAYKPKGKSPASAAAADTSQPGAIQVTDPHPQKADAAKASGVSPQDARQPLRSNVVVQLLEPMPIRDELALPAIIEASHDIILPAQSEGVLEWIGPQEGEMVTKGQLLGKIDSERFVQALNRAKAAETLAQVSWQRIRQLVDEKVVSQEELDRAQSEWTQAKAAVTIAQKDLTDSSIVSPIDGTLDDWIPDVGEFVHRGDTVAHVVDTRQVKAVVQIPEKDIAFFQVDQRAEIEKPAPLEGITPGKIIRIRMVADSASKTFPVEIGLINAEATFRPGMIARVRLLRSERPQAIVIPFFTVMQTQEGPVVFVEKDGRAINRRITVGIRQGTQLEVTEGLKAGDRLIISGQRTLSDGAPVRVVDRVAETNP